MGYDNFFLLAFDTDSEGEIPDNDPDNGLPSKFIINTLKELSSYLEPQIKKDYWSESFFETVFHGRGTITENDRLIIDQVVDFLSVIRDVTFVIYSIEFDGHIVTQIKI